MEKLLLANISSGAHFCPAWKLPSKSEISQDTPNMPYHIGDTDIYEYLQIFEMDIIVTN